jgi:hypothetical protein
MMDGIINAAYLLPAFKSLGIISEMEETSKYMYFNSCPHLNIPRNVIPDVL